MPDNLCPNCGRNEESCVAFSNFLRDGDAEYKRYKPRKPKFSIGEKVWLSISHNHYPTDDILNWTKFPEDKRIFLTLYPSEVLCMAYDKHNTKVNVYDVQCSEGMLIVYVRENELFKTKNESIDAMVACLEKIKLTDELFL